MKAYAATAALLALAAATAPAHAVTYEQGDFTPADWQLLTLRDVGAANFIVTHENSFNGNPGSFWQHLFMLPASSSANSTADVQAHINTLFTYDPGTQGALLGLDFAIDLRGIFVWAGTTAGFVRPALMQDGIVFSVVSSDAPALTSGWATSHWSFTPASAWSELLPDGTPGPHTPDFSAAGSVMSFGYRYGLATNCTSSTGCQAGNAFGAVDNYRVELTSAVPEPASFATLAAGLLLVLGALRKRRAASASAFPA